MKKFMKFSTIFPLAGLLFLAGCLVSGTFVIDVDIDDTDVVTTSEFQYFLVDLTDNGDWEDHKDDIKYIDNVGFELWVENNGDAAVTGEFYIAREHDAGTDEADEVRDVATRILSGIELAPGDNYIDWPTSLGHVENLDSLKAITETGTFVIYGLTETLPFDITLDSATVIVTVTAGN